MKLAEMADLLSGLAGTLEKFMGKTAVNDLREVSDCFRRFPDDTVASFCKYVVAAREGKATSGRGRATANGERVIDLVNRIKHYLDNHKSYDYSAIDEMMAQVRKLTNPEIKALGAAVNCPLTGTKAQMVARLESWLKNLKLSADQSSFSLSPASVG